MVLFLIFIIVCLFLLINYYVSSRDMFNPCVLFCAIHAAGLLACILFGTDYEYKFHINTLLVIMLGLISFSIINSLFLVKFKNHREHVQTFEVPNIYISVNKTIIIGIILLQLVVFIQTLYYVIGVARAYYGGDKSVSQYIGLYRSFNLYHLDSLSSLNVSRDFFSRFGRIMTAVLVYPLMAIEVNNIIVRKKVDKPICVSIVIYIAFSMLTGTRSEAFRSITAIIYYCVIIYATRVGGAIRINGKIILRIISLVVLLAYGFLAVRDLIGRAHTVKAKWYYSLVPYIGGPFMNLDNALQSSLPPTKVWGQYTFCDIINEFFLNLLNIKPYSMADINTFNYYNGLNAGNVYTTYYAFIVDFGYLGIVPLISIIAAFYCYTYYKNINLHIANTPLGTRLFFSGYMFNSLIMLIFSNRFFENILSIYTVLLVIGMSAFWKILNKYFIRWQIVTC